MKRGTEQDKFLLIGIIQSELNWDFDEAQRLSQRCYGTRSGRNPSVGNKPVAPPSTDGCGLNR
jgi:hypothetical protein